MTLGPAQLEVIRQATIAVAEEMKFDLMRTARSPVLREAGDLSCAIDLSGRRNPSQRRLRSLDRAQQ